MMDEPLKLFLGLMTGVIFGFLLQKGRVAKHDVIVNAFLLKDFTAAKIMATAGAVGSLGVYAMVEGGLAQLHVKDAQLSGMIVGGVLFGIGIVVFGYCPGTGVAAVGEGHKDALVGLVGMITGAGLYVLSYPMIQGLRESFPNLGKLTLPDMLGTSPWPWVLGFVLIMTGVYFTSGVKRKREFHYE